MSAPADTMGGMAVHAGPVVGRERETARLTAALEAAGRGEPRGVLVSGDAGVGKTRLLSDLVERARAAGATALVGHCIDVGGVGLPYLPFSEALAPLAEGRSLTALGGDDVAQLQLFDAVASALARAGEQAPVLLVLEDLHWADQSTRDLLSFLLARLRDERLLVVGSLRSDDLHRRHPLRPLLAELVRLPGVERLDLAPFDARAMGDYLAALSGGPVPEATVRRILERSEGNAYFAAELLHGERAGVGEGLPPGLADLLLARVEALPERVQQVARIASVAGRVVADDLLRRVAGLPQAELEPALREAVVHHVLVPEGRDGYAFRHALLQEAVYGDLLPGERVRLHSAYAAAVEEADGPAALLAHHRVESHDVPGALVASVRAADEAERLHAPAESWQQLERALQLWSAVPDAQERLGLPHARLAVRAAAKASRAGQLPRAVALARAAAALVDPAEEPVLAALVHQRLADHLLGLDADADALVAAQDAVQVAPEGSEVCAWACATAARALACLDRFDEAERFAERALDTAVALGLADAEADALVSLAALAGRAGRVDDAGQLLQRAVVRAREGGHLPTELRATYNVAVGLYDRGDVAGALEVLEAASARIAETGLTWSPYGLELRALQVAALFVAGDWEASAAAARMAGTHPPDAMAARLTAASLHALVAAGAPDVAATVRRLEGAWHHDPMIALFAGGNQAELLRWSDEPAAAVALVERVLRHVDDVWEPHYLAGVWLAAVGLAAAGDLAEQARLLRDDALAAQAAAAGARLHARAHETARLGHPRWGELGPEGRGWLRRADAELTRVTGCPDPAAWRAAHDEFAYGHRYEQARCRWREAEALLALDRRAEAAAAAREALEAATALGAAPLVTALEALARRGRLDVGAAHRPAAVATLTPREAEVLALLAEGRTNRQIGERLYISEKTASVHVSNILGKLGASGRTEAVSVAHRAGLLAG